MRNITLIYLYYPYHADKFHFLPPQIYIGLRTLIYARIFILKKCRGISPQAKGRGIELLTYPNPVIQWLMLTSGGNLSRITAETFDASCSYWDAQIKLHGVGRQKEAMQMIRAPERLPYQKRQGCF